MRLRIVGALSLASTLLLAGGASVGAAGPPFPPPVDNQAVYDTASVLQPGTISQAENLIDGIEARTGAEVAVYTQLVPYGITTAETEAHARALMNQWGVGRKGFDDGLVILFDLHEDDPCHGQVQLCGSRLSRGVLTNSERQAIFDNDLLPVPPRLRRRGPAGGARQSGRRGDPEHAARLQLLPDAQRGRRPARGAAGALADHRWGLMRWLQHGRDQSTSTTSIHMPAPPPGLTPAAGAVVTRSRRPGARSPPPAWTSRAGADRLPTREGGFLSTQTKLNIHVGETAPDDPAERMRLDRARSRPLDAATTYLRGRLNRWRCGA
jgi:hypothetical protein